MPQDKPPQRLLKKRSSRPMKVTPPDWDEICQNVYIAIECWRKTNPEMVATAIWFQMLEIQQKAKDAFYARTPL